MQKAKSIYLAGQIVLAEDCDFESSKKLGLICPFCSEAVFLRSGSIRETILRNKQKTTQIVKPSFAHYKGSLTSMECENRALTKEGREQIKTLMIESRNQRLKLFNKQLWDLIRQDRNVREKKISGIVKQFISNRELEVIALQSRKYWAEILPRIYESFQDMASSTMGESDFASLHNLVERPLLTESEYLEEKEAFEGYFGKVSRQYHYLICTEVADFLTTHTSGHAFYWLTKAAIFQMISLGQVKQIRDTYFVCLMVASTIYGTHWIKILPNQLESV